MTPQDERLYVTRRLGLVRHLTDAGVSSPRAQTLVSQWEAEAARRRLEQLSADFWRDGAAWVARERRTERDKGDTLRQVEDALDDVRQQPIKELGVPDRAEEDAGESAQRDAAWKHQRDDSSRQRRRRDRG